MLVSRRVRELILFATYLFRPDSHRLRLRLISLFLVRRYGLPFTLATEAKPSSYFLYIYPAVPTTIHTAPPSSRPDSESSSSVGPHQT